MDGIGHGVRSRYKRLIMQSTSFEPIPGSRCSFKAGPKTAYGMALARQRKWERNAQHFHQASAERFSLTALDVFGIQNRAGRLAIERHSLLPFIDGSIRRNPIWSMRIRLFLASVAAASFAQRLRGYDDGWQSTSTSTIVKVISRLRWRETSLRRATRAN
jgi:hypothetical protein